MKVKDFIAWIRPITALDPETDLVIFDSSLDNTLDIHHVFISTNDVSICLVDPNKE